MYTHRHIHDLNRSMYIYSIKKPQKRYVKSETSQLFISNMPSKTFLM